MKKIFCIISFISFSRQLLGQTNLVPNPSFENIIQCSTTNANIIDCANWLNFGNTPDYFNACAPIGINVPNCFTGYQYPHSGIGMAGILTWLNATNDPDPNVANYREYIAAKLTSTLSIGQKYYMSFYVNYSGYLNNWIQIGSNKTGLRFSTVPSTTSNPAPTNNFAHLKTNIIYMDTVNWLKISGSFVADSAYQYVVIGNFNNFNNTDTMSFPGPFFGSAGSYYYIDDVCVSTDSSFASSWTGINENSNSIKLKIFPNPTADFIFLKQKTSSKISEVKLLNKFGQITIAKSNFNDDKIDLTNIADGIYFIQIISDGKTYFDKIIVRH